MSDLHFLEILQLDIYRPMDEGTISCLSPHILDYLTNKSLYQVPDPQDVKTIMLETLHQHP